MSLLNKASLIQIPSGYKDGTLYSAKPTNGDGDFTFSRGSNLAATRVKDGLIEKGRENLLLQSNQFDTTWTNTNTTETGGQTGYDGSSDAWLLTKTGANGRIQQSTGTSSIGTFSVYAKSQDSNWVVLELTGISNAFIYFDLQNGVKGNIGSGVISSSIESISNGWYRCSFVANAPSGCRIYPAEENSTSATSGSILIQDAQLEVGLVATDYIETGASTAQAGILEDMPRLDYSGGATCPSLLLEPQRSNLINQSEYFGGSDWTRSGHTLTTNTTDTLSPEGKYNAAKVTATNTDPFLLDFVNVVTGDVTFSVYVKATGEAIGRNCSIHIDFSAGTAGGTNVTQVFQPSSEWQRIDVKGTATSSGTTRVRMELGNLAVIGDEYFIYGAMAEQGSLTSYIPTYGASVTRGKDTSINYNNANLPTAYPFTLYAEIDVTDTSSGYAISFLDSSVSNFYYTIEYFSNAWHITSRPSGSTNRVSSTTAITSGTHKLIGIYTDTTMTLYLDGTSIASGSNTQLFNTNINDLLLGQLRVVSDTGSRNPIKEAIVFNTELSSDEAIQLTTL